MYNPKLKTVWCQFVKSDDLWTPISHPIMKLFEAHGHHLISDSHTGLCGEKRTSEDLIDHHSGQYFGKDLWLFSYREPWFMWSMACEHSRIDRVYFFESNGKTGGLGGWDWSWNTKKSILNSSVENIEIQQLRNCFEVYQLSL